MQFDYFYGSEAEQFTFYRIPKILITSQFSKRYLTVQNYSTVLCLTE